MNANFFTLIVLCIFDFCNCACKEFNKTKTKTWCSFQNEELPCDFSFDKKFGYTCSVGADFKSIAKCKNAVNISRVNGDHEPIDKIFIHSNKDVYRVIFFKHQINYIPANLTLHFPNLRTLQIKSCGLQELTRPNSLHGLRRMYLGFNEIKNIPATYFWHFCRLEILSIFRNQISSIPQMAFRDLINLKRLSLHGNRLKTIDPLLFVRCLNLEYVDLDNNTLQSIEGDLFANLTRLSKVSMHSNDIRFIDRHFLSTWYFPNVTAVMQLKRYAIFKNNTCIDFVLENDNNFHEMQEIVAANCSVPLPKVIPPPKKPTPPPRCKPKYKPKKKLWFDYCNWHILEGFEYLYKKSF